MSGAVKIQSGCPTWHRLTVLDYHWATQPLPTPLAWFARRYTSSAVRKLGVALTLSLEGPGTLMLIAPFRVCRSHRRDCADLAAGCHRGDRKLHVLQLAHRRAMAACYDDAGLPRLFAPGPSKESPARRAAWGRRRTAAATPAARTAAAATTAATVSVANDDDDHASDSDHHRDLERRTLFRRRRRRRRRLFRLDRFPRPRGGLDAAKELDDLPADLGERRRVIAAMTTRRLARAEFDDPTDAGGDDALAFQENQATTRIDSRGVAGGFLVFANHATRRASFPSRSEVSSPAAVLANCAVMFQVAREEGKPLPSLTLGVTIEDTNRWLAVIVPAAVAYVWVALPATLGAHVATPATAERLVAVFRAVAKSIGVSPRGYSWSVSPRDRW